MDTPKFDNGGFVEKYTGDAQYYGTIVAVYYTTKGKLRYVIEVSPQGFQMIAAENTLRSAMRTLTHQ